jgi:hypothetical protein
VLAIRILVAITSYIENEALTNFRIDHVRAWWHFRVKTTQHKSRFESPRLTIRGYNPPPRACGRRTRFRAWRGSPSQHRAASPPDRVCSGNASADPSRRPPRAEAPSTVSGPVRYPRFARSFPRARARRRRGWRVDRRAWRIGRASPRRFHPPSRPRVQSSRRSRARGAA